MTKGTPQQYAAASVDGTPTLAEAEVHATGRASIAKLHTEASDAFLGQINKIDATGGHVSPTLRMAAGYAQGYRDAAQEEGK